MSVDKAFRDMIRSEVETQLRPLREAIARLQEQTGGLPALEELAAQLAPFAALFGMEVPRARKGRPVASVPGARTCAISGCGRPSRTKGYCSAHYQKLRMLERTGRRPPTWVDFAPPDTVADVVLPRGRAAAKALARGKRKG